MGDLREPRGQDYPKLSPRSSEPALLLHALDHRVDHSYLSVDHSTDHFEAHKPKNRRPPKDSPVVTQLMEKYEYPEIAQSNERDLSSVLEKPVLSVLPTTYDTNEVAVGALLTLDSPAQQGGAGRSAWVADLLVGDPEEDNLAEIYEAGFSMYLVEKGISLEE